MAAGVKMHCEEQFLKIFRKAKKLGLTEIELAGFVQLKKCAPPTVEDLWGYGAVRQRLRKFTRLQQCVGVILALSILLLLLGKGCRMVKALNKYDRCSITLPDIIVDTFRPPVDCSMCDGLQSVDRRDYLSVEEFVSRYAYSGRPVVVTDVATNWTANQVFSFFFFRDVYREGSEALDNVLKCQFFRYKTEFRNLAQALGMSEKRQEESWYFGWSNCDSSGANILRKHYSKPYFLPQESESSKTDWIFMGTPGYGAHMHIDAVGRPSWQAQIKGDKLWTLEPPPECYWNCPSKLEVLVKPGEAIVLDTNVWYHKTLVMGEEISIVIGSEYD